jgi:hypothetical protein
LGKVKLFKLQNKGKIRSDIIYQGKDNEVLRFTKESFVEKQYQEKDLLAVQREFFNRIQSELNFAQHSQNGINPDLYFIKDISECQFDRIGKFQLIDKQLFGEEVQYFIPRNRQDEKFECLLTLQNELIELMKNNPDQKVIRRKKKSIEIQLKKMASQIVQVRLNRNQIKPLQGSARHYFDLFEIDDKSYSFEKGVDLVGSEFII